VWLLVGCAGTGETTLSCSPQQLTLKFKLKDDGCVKDVTNSRGSSRDTVEICQGGVITWKVKKASHDKGNLKKSIAFVSAAGSPLKWKDSGFQADTIIGEVRGDAATGLPGFKYTVRTERGPGDVCEHDPMIIVKPR
jgi:hypothetical protein